MNKKTFTKVALKTGEMNIYDFGSIKLHAYKTNDPLEDEVFILEKDHQIVLIESPCFFDNIKELEQYLRELKADIAGMLVAYHMGGGTFLPTVKKYATKNAEVYGHSGGGKALIENFSAAFGDAFDSSIHAVTDYIDAGRINIGGIDFVITATDEAFDIEVPEIHVVYTHMLGHDCHSIVAGAGHADGLIAQLNAYISKGYELILTSHYTPEDLKDAETKIAYLNELKLIAQNSRNAEEFKNAVKQTYPDYSGLNYLDMTAGYFFA